MPISTDEYLSELCKKQERIISLLKYLCAVTTVIAMLLLGARFGWAGL